MKEIAIDNKNYVIQVKNSDRARNVRISVNQNAQISLIIPKYQSYQMAEKFLLSKINWIDKTLVKMNNRKISAEPPIFLSKTQIESYSQTLINRCKTLAQIYDFSGLGVISIKSQKTIWGSCSFNNDISLNINLIKLPQELMDYVILHELTHIKIKNHSKEFWQALEKICPEAKLHVKALKKYSLNYKMTAA